MKIQSLFFMIVFIGIFTNGSAARSDESLKLSGNILEVAIPATAFCASLGLKDYTGTQQFAKGFAATAITAYGLKYVVNEKRPRHGNYSFPSGHAAIAFYGSGFIHQRYGLGYAIPAYAAACYVAYTRVQTKEHWFQDVLGGAAIGLLYSYLLTTPYQDQLRCFYPSVSPGKVTLRYENSF